MVLCKVIRLSFMLFGFQSLQSELFSSPFSEFSLPEQAVPAESESAGSGRTETVSDYF